MKKLVVGIKDELKGYQGINLVETEEVALRDFAYACNNTPMISQNSKHFSLWSFGIFDTELGTIEHVKPNLIIDAASVVRKVEK